jgi:lipopolysaccharide assembly LptE-like protein
MIRFTKIIILRISILLLFVAFLSGCQIKPRIRTLPEEIQSVYVPMFINSSYEPGLEELATRASHEAFLSDGRLDVVKPGHADFIVQGIIKTYTDTVSSTESDDFPMMNTATVNVTVKLYSPKDRLHPVVVYMPFIVSRTYVSDVRRMTKSIPEDAKQSLMDAVGRRLVLEVITGDYNEIIYTEEELQKPVR